MITLVVGLVSALVAFLIARTVHARTAGLAPLPRLLAALATFALSTTALFFATFFVILSMSGFGP